MGWSGSEIIISSYFCTAIHHYNCIRIRCTEGPFFVLLPLTAVIYYGTVDITFCYINCTIDNSILNENHASQEQRARSCEKFYYSAASS